jgi:hypothetical protein
MCKAVITALRNDIATRGVQNTGDEDYEISNEDALELFEECLKPAKKSYNVSFYGNLEVEANSEAKAREAFYKNTLEIVQALDIDQITEMP